jgi:hypothetical protein
MLGLHMEYRALYRQSDSFKMRNLRSIPMNEHEQCARALVGVRISIVTHCTFSRVPKFPANRNYRNSSQSVVTKDQYRYRNHLSSHHRPTIILAKSMPLLLKILFLETRCGDKSPGH